MRRVTRRTASKSWKQRCRGWAGTALFALSAGCVPESEEDSSLDDPAIEHDRTETDAIHADERSGPPAYPGDNGPVTCDAGKGNAEPSGVAWDLDGQVAVTVSNHFDQPASARLVAILNDGSENESVDLGTVILDAADSRSEGIPIGALGTSGAPRNIQVMATWSTLEDQPERLGRAYTENIAFRVAASGAFEVIDREVEEDGGLAEGSGEVEVHGEAPAPLNTEGVVR